MALSLIVPPASASVVEHADWLELNALLAKDGKSSVIDLATGIRRSGSTDAVGILDEGDYCSDVGAEQSMRVAEDAFSEVEQRTIACGHNGAYPFAVKERYIQRCDEWDSSPYSVLLLLTKVGHNAGPSKLKGAKLLENLSAEAAKGYFGGPHSHVNTIVFGFPREGDLPRQFPKAVEYLCNKIGEDGNFKSNLTDEYRYKKDDGLDIVVWRDFEDKRPGKLISFGQCASGKSRDKKTGDLDVGEFCKMWMVAQPLVRPAKMFFVPYFIEKNRWRETCLRAGIIFDRCRIAYYAKVTSDKTLKKSCLTWIRHVIKHEVRLEA